MTFESLNIIEPILKAVAKMGYESPSPIQEASIPVLLEGSDLLASAQTGTGKTAAFAIPIIQAIHQLERREFKKPYIHALVLAPTRELAEQIKDNFRYYSEYLNIKTEVIYGGVSQKNQEKALIKGVDVLVATPGRLLDLMGQNLISLSNVKYFVLDEADRMLDMGFIHDVRKIVSHIPNKRQTALFSATMPSEIIKLSNELLKEPKRIEITPPEAMIDKIEQRLFRVSKKDKVKLLLDLLVNPKLQSVLVFTRTKHGANKLVKDLSAYGVKLSAIHGNKSQNQRLQALQDFKNGKIRVLVATDIAARGIDIDELSHVVNFDLPETPETYVHRMGRTGRAGLSGEAYSFCCQDEVNLLSAIEKHIKMPIPVFEKHDYHVSLTLSHQEVDIKPSRNNQTRSKKTTNDASKGFKERKQTTFKNRKETVLRGPFGAKAYETTDKKNQPASSGKKPINKPYKRDNKSNNTGLRIEREDSIKDVYFTKKLK
ncbi:MAG: DEAD/DEAH box helicase [Acholeplasma sp.]|nr:DEAD/DEAH box helicase [Acholeplasma sp.]